MTTNKLLNEKWIRDFYTELGVPCSDAHAIDWVLSHWDSLATSEREVTASMLTDINAIIATVSTGKHRTYRQARDNVLLNLDRYLIPTFGNTLVSELNLSQVDFFRQGLGQLVKNDGSKKLSNRRINNILWPLVAIMSLAAEECKFDYPFRRYKALKEERADSSP